MSGQNTKITYNTSGMQQEVSFGVNTSGTFSIKADNATVYDIYIKIHKDAEWVLPPFLAEQTGDFTSSNIENSLFSGMYLDIKTLAENTTVILDYILY